MACWVENDGKTDVTCTMEVTITGMLAQFGSRPINDVSTGVRPVLWTTSRRVVGGEAEPISLRRAPWWERSARDVGRIKMPLLLRKTLIKDTETITRIQPVGVCSGFEELANILSSLSVAPGRRSCWRHPGVERPRHNVLAWLISHRHHPLLPLRRADVNPPSIERNYQKQLLSIKIQEATDKTEAEKEVAIFGEEFLLEAPPPSPSPNRSGACLCYR